MTHRSSHLSIGRSCQRCVSRRGGFTLLELIISVAIVLALMAAVAKIFSIASDTVGASQGISNAARDARAAQAVMVHDFAAMVADSPFVIIRGQIQPAFRNRVDMEGDKNYDPSPTLYSSSSGVPATIRSFSTDGTSDERDPGQMLLTPRNHRIDTVSFFARDSFKRVTGNPGSLVSDVTSPEAWITYGHVVLPDNSNNYATGGVDTQLAPGAYNGIENPNNFFATDWYLGRVAILLKEKWDTDSQASTSSTIVDSGNTPQDFYDINPATSSSRANLMPLESYTGATVASNSQLHNSRNWTPTSTAAYDTDFSATYIYSSRYDLAATSISGYKTILANYLSGSIPAGMPDWWDVFTKYRFEANPFVYRPIGSLSTAKQSPLFISSCTQFVVEFAGDFVTQNSAGATTAATPDGTLDYFIDTAGNRQIRWYGMPRDADGDGFIRGKDGDVVPVGDIAGSVQGFERVIPCPTGMNDWRADYMHPAANSGYRNKYGTVDPVVSLTNGLGADPQYIVAWGPADTNRPKMYRITMTIDRPEMAGRTSDGQTFEYIFTVP